MAIFGFGHILKLSDFKEFINEAEDFANSKISGERLLLLNNSLRLNNNKNQILINNKNETFIKFLNNDHEIFRSIIYVEKQIVPTLYFSPEDILIESLNRYHIYRCQNLYNLMQKGAELSATSKFDGFFKYIFMNSAGKIIYQNSYQHLLICKSCLLEFNRQHNTNYDINNFQPDLIIES